MSETAEVPTDPVKEQEDRKSDQKTIPGEFGIKLRKGLQLPRRRTPKRPVE